MGLIGIKLTLAIKLAYVCGAQANTGSNTRIVFQLHYLFCRRVQPGLSKLLFNITFAEGRPSLVSDLNIVAAILAVGQPLANDVWDVFFFCNFGGELCVCYVRLPSIGMARYDVSPDIMYRQMCSVVFGYFFLVCFNRLKVWQLLNIESRLI